MQLLLQRREVRQAPRSFEDERRHAFSARRARRRQGRKSKQIQRLLQRREVRQAPRSFKDERRHAFSANNTENWVRKRRGEATGTQEK